MPEETYYVLQEFEPGPRKRWRAKQPRELPDRAMAIRIAERIRSRNLPVLAFARTGDVETGEFGEAEVIASFDVPPEFTGDHADW